MTFIIYWYEINFDVCMLNIFLDQQIIQLLEWSLIFQLQLASCWK